MTIDSRVTKKPPCVVAGDKKEQGRKWGLRPENEGSFLYFIRSILALSRGTPCRILIRGSPRRRQAPQEAHRCRQMLFKNYVKNIPSFANTILVKDIVKDIPVDNVSFKREKSKEGSGQSHKFQDEFLLSSFAL